MKNGIVVKTVKNRVIILFEYNYKKYMKNLVDYINEGIITEANLNINDVIDSIISTFYKWQGDVDLWDEPFNPEEELSKNNCEDIIDYYAGWEDVLDILGEDDEDTVYDFVKKNSKKINDKVKKEFK